MKPWSFRSDVAFSTNCGLGKSVANWSIIAAFMENAIGEGFRSVNETIDIEETIMTMIAISAANRLLDRGSLFRSEVSFPFLVVNV